jgi:hypothetical protein
MRYTFWRFIEKIYSYKLMDVMFQFSSVHERNAETTFDAIGNSADSVDDTDFTAGLLTEHENELKFDAS